MEKSLFGHIALRFVSQTENLATESLNYILNSSKTANESFIDIINIFKIKLEEPLFFRTQVNVEEGGILDLVCFDKDHDRVCIIESKFWAGLTDNQPVAYLEKLKEEKQGILLFLCPSKRISTLWRDLMVRCKEAGIALNEISIQSNIKCAKINDRHLIGAISWPDLLSFFDRQLSLSGETYTLSDLQQLSGLCNRMEEDAFIPITPEEFSPAIAKRNMDLPDLIEDVINLGISKGTINIKTEKGTLMPKSGRYHYGRYCVIRNYMSTLTFDNEKWYKLCNTPLWLNVYGRKWGSPEERLWAQNALEKLEFENPPRLFKSEGEPAYVPLKIKFGTEKNEVVESLYNEIMEIMDILDENNAP